MNSGITGVLLWGGVVITNVVVLDFIQSRRKAQTVDGLVILVSAGISTVVVHILLGLVAGFAKVMMWLLISFIWVGLVSFVVCLLAGWAYDRGWLRLFR